MGLSPQQTYRIMNTWPNYLRFRRSPNHPVRPVIGGRWQVRKQPRRVPFPYISHSTASSAQRPWRAWTTGKANARNKWFATHAEAIAYAQKQSLVFTMETIAKRKPARSRESGINNG